MQPRRHQQHRLEEERILHLLLSAGNDKYEHQSAIIHTVVGTFYPPRVPSTTAPVAVSLVSIYPSVDIPSLPDRADFHRPFISLPLCISVYKEKICRYIHHMYVSLLSLSLSRGRRKRGCMSCISCCCRRR